MSVHEEIKTVKTKEDFINFLGKLATDKKNNPVEWENKAIENYLESIQSWIEDMEGYYVNNNIEVPKNIDWNFFATVFYVGKIYE
ncbi:MULTISPECIES: hypothetical protein [Eubacteriales]|uniref:DUF7660 domain-containing protein n=1 Tax=Ruminiclostridium papyrosolvens C7 TaxID=1330534 RepID=U4QWZ5_9FIRM|nr:MULTISPECIES: hypothetical protein [Eubacteriales]AEY67516.1 hypothetical protein Clo1100_3379 [Clostridium sp. BNL1100]EPR08076.1 hypothetical protein L323_18220 [Ruminiclostridium papyrosolvens C7]